MAREILKPVVVCRLFCIGEMSLGSCERLWCSWSRREATSLNRYIFLPKQDPQFWTCGFVPFPSAQNDLPSLGNLTSRFMVKAFGRRGGADLHAQLPEAERCHARFGGWGLCLHCLTFSPVGRTRCQSLRNTRVTRTKESQSMRHLASAYLQRYEMEMCQALSTRPNRL